jgi:nitroimidazol reductase NimA-like FMN-containing flavoprotein (pyridoxamine 5'-phosphate oxidase superfamily)
MNPNTSLDPRFGDSAAEPISWSTAEQILDTAETFWLTTVRRDGRPHVTTLVAVWADDALNFTTGAGEQKAVNLRENNHVVLTTGCNQFSEGIDLVVEGRAVRVTETAAMQRIADRYKRKYDWNFTVEDGAFVQEGELRPLAFRVEPEMAFGFKKGNPFGQTRWRFGK